MLTNIWMDPKISCHFLTSFWFRLLCMVFTFCFLFLVRSPRESYFEHARRADKPVAAPSLGVCQCVLASLTTDASNIP